MITRLSSDDGYKGWFVEWIEEWSQFLGGHNWYTFHPIHIKFEDDRMMGGVEAKVIVLGLGFRARWNYTVTKQTAELIQSVEDIKGGKVATEDLRYTTTEARHDQQ